MYNDHYLYNKNLNIQRQIRWDGCSIGTISHVSRKAIDKFQYIWITMIDELYKLIVEYLGNGFR